MTYYLASLSGMMPYLSSFLASFEMLVNFKFLTSGYSCTGLLYNFYD